MGAKTLLVDEDTCATNFMIRDARMQALVAKEKEPITPFIAKVCSRESRKGRAATLGLHKRTRRSTLLPSCYSAFVRAILPQQLSGDCRSIFEAQSDHGQFVDHHFLWVSGFDASLLCPD